MKKTIILIFTLATTVLVSAQSKHEASVYLGAGISSLKYDLNASGDASSKVGPLAGVGYTYKITSQWGLVSGLELAIYKTEVTSDQLKDQYVAQDDYGNDFEWRLALHGFKESQTGTYLNVPIMAQFTPGTTGGFYANLGFKVGLPMSGKYDASYSKLVTSGHYLYTDAEYPDIDFRGFGQFGGSSTKGDIDLGVAFMLSAQCGMKWNLSNSMKLFAGAYIDYGLNNIVKTDNDKKIIKYNKNNPTNLEYNGLTTSKTVIDKIVPFALGLKVGLDFSL